MRSFLLVVDIIVQPTRHFLNIDRSIPRKDVGDKEAKLLLDYVDIVGELQGIQSEVETPTHLLWTCNAGDSEYPEPIFHPIGRGSSANADRQTLQLVLRHSGPPDGGVEFLFERRLWMAIKLLLGSFPSTFVT